MNGVCQSGRRMRTLPIFSQLAGGLAVAAVCMPLTQAVAHADKAKNMTMNWKPGITLVGDVALSDGQTPENFSTPQGAALWDIQHPQPIPQGDKLKLNVFVATGGADLSEIKVRLDNTLIADLTAAPWSVVIDTSKLSPGSHMFDVWAQATGHPPQDSDASLVFNVRAMGSANTGPAMPPPAPLTGPPPVPDIAAGQPTDPNAEVALYYGLRQMDNTASDAGADTPISAANDTIVVQNPIHIKVRAQSAQNSTATQFVYAIVSDGTVIKTSPEAYPLLSATQPTDTTIAIQRQALGDQQGLPHGQYELWVWGLNGSNHPSSPEEVILQVP
jgi:hypothetical protein